MTRDAVTTYIPYAYEYMQEWDDGSVSYSSMKSSTGLSEDRRRSDLIHSNHIVPTKYSANRHMAHVLYFDQWGDWLRGYNPVQRRWGYYRQRQRGLKPTVSIGEGKVSTGHVPTWVQTSARTRARAKCAQADVNIGQFLGEMPESLKMIASQSISVLQAYRALRRGQFSKIPRILGVDKVKNLPKSAAGVWFAYKFGWKPLIEDTYNMHSAVMKQLNRPTFGKVKAVQTTHTSDPYWILTNSRFDGNITMGCEVGLTYKVENERLAQLNALGLINPLSIAWELMPLSFVVDWFVPVGSFLQSMSAPLGLSFVAGYETVFVREEGKVSYPSVTYPHGTPPATQVESFAMKRSVLLTWPVPGLYIRTNFNTNQALTLAGLIAQRAS